MKIKYFRSVRFKNDWEINFISKRWNLRIARGQIALWIGETYEPIFGWINMKFGGTGPR